MRTYEVPSGEPWNSGRAVAEVLLAAGYETYAAGGCVRDLLLGLPVHDIDLATVAHPEQVEAVFRLQGWRTIAVGKAFGVVVVVTPHGANIEVATFRTDGAYIDGRRPSTIVFSSAREDVERRDFTINALLYEVRSGVLIDHVGGRADLSRGIIRAVGDPQSRLCEDRLRVLRGLRFAARFSFAIEPATWSAIRATPVTGLSGERVMQELTKSLLGPGRSRWLQLVRASGHLSDICAPLADCSPDVLDAVASRLDLLQSGDPLALRLAVMLSPLALPAARLWLMAQPLSTVVVRSTQWLLEHGCMLSVLLDRPLSARRRLWLHPDGQWLGRMISVLHGGPDQDEAVRTLLKDAARDRLRPWSPLLRAQDLMALGLAPGPRLGLILREVEDADLEGHFPDRASAIAFAKARITATENPRSNPGQSDQGTR